MYFYCNSLYSVNKNISKQIETQLKTQINVVANVTIFLVVRNH